MIEELRPELRLSLDELKAAVKRQAFALALDEARAVAALPKLLPAMAQRREAVEAARRVAGTRGLLTEEPGEPFSPDRARPRLGGGGARAEIAQEAA